MVVDPAEQPFVAPAAEVAKGRAFGWQILRDQAPRDAPAQHVEDGIQDLAGGPGSRATARGRLRHERGNHPPLRICQVCFVTKAGAAMLPPGNRGPHGTSRSGFSTRLESPPSRILNPLSPVSGRALTCKRLILISVGFAQSKTGDSTRFQCSPLPSSVGALHPLAREFRAVA